MCSGEDQKISKLKKFFADKGITGNWVTLLHETFSFLSNYFTGEITLESCKQYKIQQEQEKELADLNKDNIILTEGKFQKVTREL